MVSLSIRSPHKGGFSFPFLKDVKRRADGPQAFSEPASQILPEALLRDMYEDATFNITFGIGIPENPYFPTLSFEDFCLLSSRRPLTWKAIQARALDSYTKLAATEHPNGGSGKNSSLSIWNSR